MEGRNLPIYRRDEPVNRSFYATSREILRSPAVSLKTETAFAANNLREQTCYNAVYGRSSICMKSE
jgi:hypothetical protein